MNFAYPLVLFLLAIPAALIVWVFRRDGRRIAMPFDGGVVGAGLRADWILRTIIGFGETIPALVLAAVIVILAGPRKYDAPKDKRVLANIELCVDISGSMTAQFGDGTRYDASMKAIEEFLDFRKGDAFGLTFFGSSYIHFVPLTSDVSAIRCAPPFMRPEMAPGWFGGTEIGKALTACRKVLADRREGDRMIILITDGYSADLDGGADARIAKELTSENITVFAVLIGESSIPDEVVNICSLTGGEAFNAGDVDGLKHVFRRIDEMKTTRLEKTIAEPIDDFFLPAAIGAGLLAMAVLCALGLRYTPW